MIYTYNACRLDNWLRCIDSFSIKKKKLSNESHYYFSLKLTHSISKTYKLFSRSNKGEHSFYKKQFQWWSCLWQFCDILKTFNLTEYAGCKFILKLLLFYVGFSLYADRLSEMLVELWNRLCASAVKLFFKRQIYGSFSLPRLFVDGHCKLEYYNVNFLELNTVLHVFCPRMWVYRGGQT